jgi:hypothetical protein
MLELVSGDGYASIIKFSFTLIPDLFDYESTKEINFFFKTVQSAYKTGTGTKTESLI